MPAAKPAGPAKKRLTKRPAGGSGLSQSRKCCDLELLPTAVVATAESFQRPLVSLTEQRIICLPLSFTVRQLAKRRLLPRVAVSE